MTLEDFFKGKGPDNYVEYPPKESPSLEQFFAERTIAPRSAPKMSPNVSPEVQAAADTAPKLSDQDVDRLAAQANPQMSFSSEVSSSVKGPMEVPTAPAPTQPTVDTDAQFKMLIEEMRKNKPEASWGDFLTGLIPVGLDLLVGGGKGYALPASVGYYNKVLADVDKRGASLESKIAELQKLRAMEMLKEPKTLEVDVEGKPIITPVRQALGKEAWKSAERKGLTFEERMKIAEAGEKGKESRQERAIKIATRDKVASNREFVAARNSYGAANQAVDILNNKTWAGDAGIPSLFAKGIFKEVGAMSDSDKAVFFGDPAFVNKFNSVYAKYLDPKGGTYTDEDRAILMDLALKIREKSKREANMVASGYVEGLSAEGIDASSLVRPLLKYNDTAPSKDVLKFLKTNQVKKPTYEEWKKMKGL